MKKIIITAGVGLVCSFGCLAQSAPSAAGNAKVMTAAEANALNGTAQPTINGKPYSQYKAEQEALKRQKAAQQQTAPIRYNSSNTGMVDIPVQPARSVTPDANRQKEGGNAAPQVEAAVVKKAEVTSNTIAPPAGGNAGGLPAANSTAKVIETGMNVPAGAVAGSVITGENKPAQQVKPASRTAAEIEASKQPVVDAKVTSVKPNAATSGPAPVPPAATEQKSTETNSSNGEKPAQAPAPKQGE